MYCNLPGYHNYHHTFPWDYSASELGFRYNFNLTTLLIDFFEKCGLAYDLKKPPVQMIQARMQRSGDGTNNRTVRPNKFNDWTIGIFVTCSQLIVSLSLRWICMAIKSIYKNYYSNSPWNVVLHKCMYIYIYIYANLQNVAPRCAIQVKHPCDRYTLTSQCWWSNCIDRTLG